MPVQFIAVLAFIIKGGAVLEIRWMKRRNETSGVEEKFYPISHKDAIVGLTNTLNELELEINEGLDNLSSDTELKIADINSVLNDKSNKGHIHNTNDLIAQLDESSAVLRDTNYFVANTNTNSTGDYKRRPISALWEYIKSKTDSLYIKDLSSDGKTVTYTKGDGTTGEIFAQLNELGQVSLDVLNWSDTAPYTQTVQISNVKETDLLIVECIADVSTNAEKKRLQKAFNMVDEIVTGNGSITATAYFKKPIATLPLVIRK